MKKATMISVAVMAAGLALSASAKEQPVGMLGAVKGNVSVGGHGFVSKAGSGTPVFNGSKILVATDGRATVEFKDGCSVALSGGQHMTVDNKLNCSQQQAAVQQLFQPYRLAQLNIQNPPAGAVWDPKLGAWVWGGSVIIFDRIVANDKVSPN